MAAVHLIYLITTFPERKSTIAETKNAELLPLVAEIQVALVVCKTFVPFGVALFVTSCARMQRKRYFTVAGTVLLAFTAQCRLFFISTESLAMGGLRLCFVALPNLVVALWGYALAKCSMDFDYERDCLEEGRLNDSRSPNSGEMVAAPPRPGAHDHPPGGSGTADKQSVKARQRSADQQGESIVHFLLSLVWPVSIQSVTSPYIPVVLSANEVRGPFTIPILYLQSTCHITDLDQAVALAGGVATLAFSCWDAFKSQSSNEEVEDRSDSTRATTSTS